ncbi:hypothetical protein KIW84_034951 [Lathyrus oleraceus]|uniref:RING-type domain-containing protein n=1 Tax=Pisum sativum TaxID=3888 RepID=A0A9D4Y0R8_PEA|nr:hypothetical protein KIW84_034951 [Pisum sativum]
MAHRTKFDPKAHKAVFIGYKEGTKGYILYDLTHHSIFVSRHVIFYENTFSFKSRIHSQDSQSSASIDSTNPAFPLYDDTVPIAPSDNNLPELQPSDNNLPELQPLGNNLLALQPSGNNLPAMQPSDNTLSNVPHTLNSGSPSNLLINDNLSPSSLVHNSPPSPLSISPTHPPVNINDDQPPVRHSTRASNPPSYLADYHCFSTAANPSSSKVTYPLSAVLSYSNCSPDFHHFCCSISSNPEPSSFLQANKFECWKHAMNVELQALDDNHTWTLVDLPPGKGECPICLEAFEDAVLTPCAHRLCQECLLTSWRNSTSGLCPVCRKMVSKQDVITAPTEIRLQVDIEENRVESCKVTGPLNEFENLRSSGSKGIVFSQWSARQQHKFCKDGTCNNRSSKREEVNNNPVHKQKKIEAEEERTFTEKRRRRKLTVSGKGLHCSGFGGTQKRLSSLFKERIQRLSLFTATPQHNPSAITTRNTYTMQRQSDDAITESTDDDDGA